MRRETPAELKEPWMKKLKIAPLVLDADLLDLSQKFRSRLYESLVSHGWDSSQSMIIATSEDPRLDGQILQGRHRCFTISQIMKDGHKFNTSKILIRYEEVATVDELRAKRAAYEATATLTKDPKLSKKWIDSNLNPIIKARAQEGQTKIIAYLHDCGFYQDSISAELIDRELAVLEKKRVKRSKQSYILNRANNEPWTGPKPETIDNATTYLRTVDFQCEHCHKPNKVDVNIQVGHTGDLLQLAAAR